MDIFVLADAHFSDAETLDALLKKQLDHAGTVFRPTTLRRFSELDAVLSVLKKHRRPVLCLGADHVLSESFESTFLTPCRELNPATQFLSVLPLPRHARSDKASRGVEDSHESALSAHLQAVDCHWLRPPYDALDMLHTLSRIERFAQLEERLKENSQKDEKTGLYHRSTFLQRLREEISLAKRHESSLCCVVIGINGYELLLDSYGYDFINALTLFLADSIRESIRNEDVAAKISDEELAILLPRSTEQGAAFFAKRLLQELNASEFHFKGISEPISLSAGLVGFPSIDGAPITLDTMLRYGRHALHQARRRDEGQGAVQLFSEIHPSL